MKDTIIGYFEESSNVKLGWVNRNLDKIAAATCLLIERLRAGNKVLLFGNGGSAADAQHLASELVNRFRFDRPALPAIALSTDSSVVTSIANDAAYKQIFARQIEALGVAGDVAIGISTSGKSENVIEGIKAAQEKDIHTIVFTGSNGGKLAPLTEHALIVNSEITSIIQETHMTMGHAICRIIEAALFPECDPENQTN